MRFALAVLFLSSLAFGQGSVVSGNPVAINSSGQPIPGALVAICTTNPGTSAPPCSSLATIYTDITLTTACSGAAASQPLNNANNPSVGTGCSNPGLTDQLGNVVAYAGGGSSYFCQYYGPNITTTVQPCIFPATLNNLLSGTNTFTGSNFFNGGTLYSGASTFSGPVTLTGGGTLTGGLTATFKSINSSTQYADQYPTVQAAINALPAGGGTVYLTCGGTFGIPTNIPSGVTLRSTCPATTATYGPYSTTLVAPSSWMVGPANGIAIIGINVSLGGSGNLILNNVAQSYFDMSVSCVTGSPCVNPVASSGVNVVHNRFDYLNITTAGAIGMQLSGSGSAFVTDNDFRTTIINMTLPALGSITEALGFTQNCDSNHFGTLHISLTNVSSGNGLVFNDSGTPTVDTDADNEVIDLVDFTSATSATGSTYVVNKSNGNKWTEGFGQGSFTTTITADSTTHYIREILDGAGVCLGFNCLESAPGTSTINATMPTGASVNANIGMNFNPTNGFYQSKRAVAGCTTSGGASPFTSPCTTVVTWPTPFADASYTATCSGNTIAAGVPILQGITNKVAASVTVQTQQATGVNAGFSFIECTAVHD